jgi:hypothetical protein
VRENPDPGLTFTFEKTVNGDTTSLDLAVGHPCATDGLETEVTEAYVRSALCVATPASTMGFPELGSFGH